MSSTWEIESKAERNTGNTFDDWFASLWEKKEVVTPRGWENYSMPIFDKTTASKTYFQGTPALPITFYKWFSEGYNTLVEPEDPFQIEMFITYGPMILFDVDKMTEAIADDIPLDENFYYDAYWMSLNVKGTTVAFREEDHVIQYMAIENPAA